jgi:isopenicillin N synthase-like dioxygenase
MRLASSQDDHIGPRPVSLTELPVIDFEPFHEGDDATRDRIAAEIADACEEIGFFTIKGHRVPQALREEIFAQSARFFSLPVEKRAEVAATEDWYRGWLGTQPGEKLARNSRLFEHFRMQCDLPADDPDVMAGSFFHKPNRWPNDLDGFAETCNAYFAAMEELSGKLLHAFARGIGLPEDRLDGMFDKPVSQLSLMYNPPLPPEVSREVTNMVPHTDDTPFTILAQDKVGGLEVKRRDGEWILVPPDSETLTINVGDMMMWWSNGRYLSNAHRVRNISGDERYSIPFFLNPSLDVTVSPLPELIERDGRARYEPVSVRQHLSRFYASFKRQHDE